MQGVTRSRSKIITEATKKCLLFQSMKVVGPMTTGNCHCPSRRYRHTQGYQAMGSFHSENVDELMALPDEDYIPPILPFDTSSSFLQNIDSFSCDEKKENCGFLLDRTKWTFLNHGAFGAALRIGYERAEMWRFHLERQPLRYFDRELLPHLVFSARRLADFCDGERESTTLIPNVTYGLNTILRGYGRIYDSDSHVILWDTSYGSLKKMAHRYCNKVTEISVSSSLGRCWTDFRDDPHEVFVHALTETLDSLNKSNVNLENALLVLDHTTSNTAINMPLQNLSKIARERNMLVMVDGAHGLLAQSVSMKALPNIDFYVANGHKWLSCPRGIGLMYCRSSFLRETILEEPAVMSHGIGQGFQSRFLWDGCRDYAAALSVPAVLDYWQQTKGIDKTQQDIQAMLLSAVQVLALAWHDDNEERPPSLENSPTLVPLEVHSPMMALVRLPERLQKRPSTSDDAKEIQDYLYDQFIEVPIKCIEGVLYVRISCHVYNELTEYERLAQCILDMKPPS